MKPIMFATVLALTTARPAETSAAEEFVDLFPTNGTPAGWLVRSWDNVANAPPPGAVWKVEDGILNGSNPRGTWLVSEKDYGDFVLEFEWKLGERGHSGCGLRFPPYGDPAFNGLELQMVDPRYYGTDKNDADTLTGAIYKAVAPTVQIYRPLEWNKYAITCRGPNIKVELNGKIILEVDLSTQTKKLERGAPLNLRPRKGRIGFQELSRGGGHVAIRNARVKELN
ncbi:MAG: DUF1080 domain-containing protein [Verrucomicrobia bacterium]|nr:DUF1080 domain-containing protein [Verrucomicrobiota bacterium]